MIDIDKIWKYLKEFEANNNRDWFRSHKEQRIEANIEFEKLVQELQSRIHQFDATIGGYNPKDLTFKQVRDTRYSHDKTPYNPVFRAHIAPKGKSPIPVGYFICIRSYSVLLGGGLFTNIFNEATTMIRDYIDEHGEQWEQIVEDKEFKKEFTVAGEKLKNVPRGYFKEHPQSEYLKYKSWYLECCITDIRDVESLITTSIDKFKIIKPFNDYINQALIDFKMPER